MALVREESTHPQSVDALVQRLVRELQPEFIYLFGSRARGDAADDSDYDFMVILPDNAPDRLLRWPTPARALEGVNLGRFADIKLKRRSEFPRQLHLKASIPSAVMRDGRCLYACPSAKHLIAPPAPASHRVSEPIQPPYDPVRVENTRDWIRVARDDLRIAELLLQQEMFDQCLFHCQQSVEKALKALLTWHDEPVPRSHALPDLGACCLRLAPSIMPELRASYELARWAVDGRYPPPKSNPSEAAFGLRLARQAVDALMSEIPSSVRAI